MKNSLKIALVAATLSITQLSRGATVTINNAAPLKIEANFDLMAYPDTKKIISENSSLKEDIGKVFLRGVSIGVHIGNNFIENILSENLSQTLGLGDIEYYVFSELKNDGRKNSAGEFIVEFKLYLLRLPRFIYSGGCVAKSETFKVVTIDFETFRLIKEEKEQNPNSHVNSMSNSGSLGYSSTNNR